MPEHEAMEAHRQGGPKPDSGGRKLGVLIAVLVLIIVAGVVAAGIIPR
jgi:hypothetical protein